MMRTTARCWRTLQAVCALAMAVLAGPAPAAVTISNTGSAPIFFTDSGNTPVGLVCNYLAFSITSTASVTDLWATIGSFTGAPARLSIGGGDDGLYHVGAMAANVPKYAFFYVCSSLTGGGTAAGQGYTINTYDRDPALGGAVNLGAQTFATSIDDSVIAAAANKVTVVVSGPNPATLGGIMTITVEGDSGTIGNAPGPNGPLSFTPASYASWAASAFELYGTSVQFSGGNSGVFDNQLYFSALPNSGTTHYIATYFFRAVTTTAGPASVSPIVHIASGTQVKHTDTGGFANLQPVLPASNTILVAKTANAASLPAQGGTVTYTLSIGNTGPYTVNLDQIQDTLPAGAAYLAGSSAYNNLAIPEPVQSGQILAWAHPFSVPANGSRSLTFQASLPATAGVYVNKAVAKISTTQFDTTYDINDNAPATASTRVLQAISATKSFSPVSTDANTLSTLTLTITNNNTVDTLTGVAIADTYPAGLVHPTLPNYATTCSGATLAGGSPGGNSIGMTGATLAPGASCTLSIGVLAVTAGAYVNTTSAPSSANAGSGTPASATLYVPSVPTVTKSFTPSTIAFGATATLSLQVVNSSAVNSLTSVAFSDSFPANLQVAATPALTNTCGGSVTGASAASTAVSLSGGSVAASTSCLITLAVTATTAGAFVNAASGVTSTETGGPGPASNTATLRVLAPPNVVKAFAPISIAINSGVAVLNITLTNPNTVDLTGAAFTDTYPAGLTNTATPAAATTCGGGSVTAAADGASVSLSGGVIPAGGSCTVTVAVKVTSTGAKNNTLAIGSVSTANGGANTAAASATLTGNNLVSVAKAFTVDATIGSATYGITTLSITLTNNNPGITATGLLYTDTLPSGMEVAVTPTLTGNCGGTFQSSADGVTWGAVTAGHRYLRLGGAGGSISNAGVGFCTTTLRVVTTSGGGIYTNQTSGVTSTIPAGTGNPSNIARLTPPILNKAFTPATIGAGRVSTMTVTVVNVDTTRALSSLSFTDAYPAGLDSGGGATAKFTNAAPVSFSNSCGGSLQSSTDGVSWGAMTAGHTYLRLSSASVATGGSCTVAVAVTGANEATHANITSKVVTAQGVGTVASDVLYVKRLPTLTKAFVPSAILFGGASTMAFVVTNNYTAAVTGLAFSDTFPPGLQIASPPNAANTCSATLESSSDGTTWGAVTAAHTFFRMRAAASVAAAATCTATVRVTSSTEGFFDNQSTGALYTAPSGGAAQPNVPGPKSNIATLTVNLNPATVTKSFGASVVPANAPVTLSVTVTNPNSRALTGVALTDTYPANLLNATPSFTTSTCGGSVAAVAGGSTLILSGGALAASASCTLTSRVIATTGGTYTNLIAAGAVTAANASASTVTASAQVIATLPATVSKAFSPTTVQIGTVASIGLTITNPNPLALTGLAFVDTFPPGLIIAASPATFNSCGGSLGATAGGSVLALSGGTIAAGGSCVISVPVSASAAGTYINVAGAPVSDQTSQGVASNAAVLTVTAGGLFGAVYLDSDVNGTRGATETWAAGTTLYVKLASRSGAACANPAIAVVTVNPGPGDYAFSNVAAGDYCLTLDDNATLADTTPTLPAGWFLTTPTSGLWFASLGPNQAGGYNFGLINASPISGRVFSDTGSGGGTANDGIQNGTEAGIPVVPITLTNCAATTYANAFTTGNGDYVFRVPAGATTLCVVETNLAAYLSTGSNVQGTALPNGAATVVGGVTYTYTRSTDRIAFSNAANTTFTQLNFADVPHNNFVASQTKQAEAGGFVTYAHTFTSGSAGDVSFSASASAAPASPVWSEVLYRDTNCNGQIDVGEPVLTAPVTGLAAGQLVCLVLKQFTPPAAPFGAANQVRLTASYTYANTGGTLTDSRVLTDFTSIGQGGITLVKEVCNSTTSSCNAATGAGFSPSNQARPGDTLQYRILYSNPSTAGVTSLVISDATPPFTLFAAADCLSIPAGMGCSATVPAVNAAGGVRFTMTGALPSGGTGIVTFDVKVE